jgi:hypothetical protein
MSFLMQLLSRSRVFTLIVAELGFLSMQTSKSEEITGLEIVWEVSDTPSTLYVRVASNGCTEEADFRVNRKMSRNNPRIETIEIIRLRPDTCKGREPAGKVLKFKKGTIGLKPLASFLLVNPFGTTPLFKGGMER